MHVQEGRTPMALLRELLDSSKTADGRQRLLETGVADQLTCQAVQALSSRENIVADADAPDQEQYTSQLLLLRLLRNCCALGAAAVAILVHHELHCAVAQAADHVSSVCHGLQSQHGRLSGCQSPPQEPNGSDNQHPGRSEQQAVDNHLAHPDMLQQRLADWLLAAVQLLHNISAAGPDNAAAVWSALYPTALEGILLVDDGRVHEAAALTVLSCARVNSQTLGALTSPAAHTAWYKLLAPLMPHSQETSEAAAAAAAAAGTQRSTHRAPADIAAQQAPQQQSAVQRGLTAAAALDQAIRLAGAALAPAALPPGNDNLCLLVKFVAMQQNKLQQLMQVLSKSGADSQPAARPLQACEQHAVLLHVIAMEAAAVPAASPLPGLSFDTAAAASISQQHGNSHQDIGLCTVSGYSSDNSSQQSSNWLRYTVDLLQDVWSQAVAAAATTAGVCSSPTATGHVLEAVLQVLKAVLARDEDTAEVGTPAQQAGAAAATGLAAVAQYLQGLGLVQQLLQMLTALGPPPKAKHQQQRELEEQQQRAQGQASQPAQQPAPQSPAHQQPYAGYRADVVAVLGNLLLGGPDVQDAVMAAGGIELLLTNCNLDESAPMAREWALWGIRNACEGNKTVQEYLGQFQAVDAVHSPELDKMGMQLELDQMTHKLTLKKKQEGTQGS